MVNKKKQKSLKSKLLGNFLIGVLVLVIINIISDSLFQRFDLTKEKRFTLSESTQNLLDLIDEDVYINVFLDGNLPLDYRHLKSATRDLLTEYRMRSNGLINFNFEDVLADQTKDEKEEILNQFRRKGLRIEAAEVQEDEAATNRYIIPAAMVFYKGREVPLNLLKREFGNDLNTEINGSIELLEYEIGTALRKCIAGQESMIGFTEGHGELSNQEIADVGNELNSFYKVERVNLNLLDSNCYKLFGKEVSEQPNRDPSSVIVESLIKKLRSYNGLVVAKPTQPFSDIEKVVLDQYVMNGGKLIFLVEDLIAEMDSVAKSKTGVYSTSNHKHNLNDLLFNYGVRVKPNLIQDLQCNGIPAINQQSNKPGFFPWWFYPLFNPEDDNVITRNLESVWGQYCSSIDTTSRKTLKHTVLLRSSPQSRVAQNPVFISLDMLKVRPDPNNFANGDQVAAVLVEGEFKSPFTFRPSITKKFDMKFRKSIDSNAIIVIGDGDIIRNQVYADGSQVYPLGYDKYASQHFKEAINFANKKFFLNCVDYMCDANNLIEVRSKEVVLRLLDKSRIKTERTKWQTINMVLPIALVVLFGLINFWYRKRKWV